MTRGLDHYLQNIVEDSFVDVYTATNTAMLEYPFVLGHVNESSPTLCDKAERFILDSTIGDESVGNEEVYERGRDLGADWILAADVMGEPQETTNSIIELLEIVSRQSSDEYDPRVVLPLQADDTMDRVTHYEQIVETASFLGYDVTDNPVAVGGIRDLHPDEQVSICRRVRANLGSEPYIHALGCGITLSWVEAIRKTPDLVDSLDTSSIAQNVINGKMLTPELEYVSFNMPRGSNSTALTTMARMWQLYLFNYLIGPHIREEDIPVSVQPSPVSAD